MIVGIGVMGALSSAPESVISSGTSSSVKVQGGSEYSISQTVSITVECVIKTTREKSSSNDVHFQTIIQLKARLTTAGT